MNARWKRGLTYTAAFLVAFVGSAAVKLIYNPLGKMMQVNWTDSVGQAHTDIAYGNAPANKFDLYVPADKSKPTYGLVVYIHAGGFTGGDKADDAQMAHWLVSKGYVAATVNYTLRNEQNPDASVYRMSQEIKESIPAIKAEAAKLGYNLDRMAIAGGSAGGTLAMLYAYRDAGTSPLPVKLVFQAVGPASFYPQDWYGLGENPEGAAGLFSIMSGKKITPDMIGTPAYEEAIKDISPYMWVNENSPPTLAAYGQHDKVAPFAASKYLAQALEKHNVPHDYLVFPHSGHGLQNDDDQYRLYTQKTQEYLEKYLK